VKVEDTNPAPTGEDNANAKAEDSSQPIEPNATVASSMDKVRELEESLAKANAYAERMKEAEKAERQKRQAAKEEVSTTSEELTKMREEHEALQKQNNELMSAVTSMTPVVEHYARESEKAAETVAARTQELPSYMQAALANRPPMEALSIINQYDAENTVNNATAPTAAPSNTTTPPPTDGSTVDFAALVAAGHDLKELQANYPEQWQAKIASSQQPTAPIATGFLAGLYGNGAASRKG